MKLAVSMGDEPDNWTLDSVSAKTKTDPLTCVSASMITELF